MTKIIVNPGICGFIVEITAKKDKDKKINISFDTECDMVREMLEDIRMLDMRTAFTGYLNNPVYRSSAKHLRHVACPVPSGILKAIEVEAGICLPRDVTITFLEIKK